MSFSEEKKAKITKNYSRIVNDLSLDRIMDKLISKGVLSIDDRQGIISEKTQSDKNRKFIEVLLKCPGRAYDEFIKALKTDEAYKDLADQIEKTEVDIQEPTPTTPESWLGVDKITSEKKNTHLSDLHILGFSKAIKPSRLSQVYPFLGFNDVDLESIKCNHSNSSETWSQGLLKKWSNKNGPSATAGNLLEKLFNIWKETSDCINQQVVQKAWENL